MSLSIGIAQESQPPVVTGTRLRAIRQARGSARDPQDTEERSRQSYVPSYYFVLLHTALGEKDLAFEWLERTYQERSTVLAYLRLDPRLAPLRADPRFASLLARLGVGA